MGNTGKAGLFGGRRHEKVMGPGFDLLGIVCIAGHQLAFGWSARSSGERSELWLPF